MGTAEIIALISLCSTVLFAVPPFVKMIIDLCSLNKTIAIEIVGGQKIQKNKEIELYIQIINTYKESLSITNIKINNTRVLLHENEVVKAPMGLYFKELENKIVKVICPKLNENEKIEVSIFTSKRKKSYKKVFDSYLDLCKNYNQENNNG